MDYKYVGFLTNVCRICVIDNIYIESIINFLILQEAKKGITIESFPSVLHLQLKRFEYDLQDATVKKVFNEIIINRPLDYTHDPK